MSVGVWFVVRIFVSVGKCRDRNQIVVEGMEVVRIVSVAVGNNQDSSSDMSVERLIPKFRTAFLDQHSCRTGFV